MQSRANARTPSSSRGLISSPSYSNPPRRIAALPMTVSWRSFGQAMPGRIASDAGAASRRMPIGSRSRRRMMALAGWVVPSIAWVMCARSTSAMTSSSAIRMPSLGSGVVAVLVLDRTLPPSSTTTASVFVPPTSMPIRSRVLMRSLLPWTRSPRRSQMPWGRQVPTCPADATPGRRATR